MKINWNKNMILLAALFFCMLKVTAQNCPEKPETKKGVWKKGNYSVPHAPTTNPETLKNQKAILSEVDSIGALFIRYNPQPVGSEARWHASLSTEGDSVTSPDLAFTDYMYNAGFFPYYCSQGSYKTISDTKTWIYLSINSYWSSGYTEQHEFNNLLDEQVFTLAPQRGTLGGYPVFEPIPIGEWDDPKVLFYSVLIHHPGKLPYQTVTKGEFFEMNRKLIDKKEIEYKKGIDYQRKNMGEDWYKEQSERIKNQAQAMRDNFDQLVKLYEKELSQPAILRTWEWTIRDMEIANPTEKKLFTTANRGYQLVRANRDYMDQSRTKWKPQFMWVQWSKDLASQNSYELDKVMHEQFDFKELGKLLTK